MLVARGDAVAESWNAVCLDDGLTVMDVPFSLYSMAHPDCNATYVLLAASCCLAVT